MRRRQVRDLPPGDSRAADGPVLGHALAILADEAYDHVYRTGMCRDGRPGPLGAVLPCVTSLNR